MPYLLKVQDAVPKAPECRCTELSHVSKQENEINVVVRELAADCLVAPDGVLIGGAPNPDAGDVARTSEFQNRAIGLDDALSQQENASKPKSDPPQATVVRMNALA